MSIHFRVNVEGWSRVFELNRLKVYEKGQLVKNLSISQVMSEIANKKLTFCEFNGNAYDEEKSKQLFRMIKRELHQYWRMRKHKKQPKVEL